jgi:RNA 3'-terminal phosphate cyclase-like protein
MFVIDIRFVLLCAGFGGSLFGETTTGVVLTSDIVCPKEEGARRLPEDLGKELAWNLLEEISRGGVVDSNFQSLAILYMVFTQRDVSQIVTGPLSHYT